MCICGAGPAGITIARKLAEKGRSVALLEGGGYDPSVKSQQLYEGDSIGAQYSIAPSRLRYFGGASNHWGGETRPLDARDFQPLDFHELNHWPITKHDLDIHKQETEDILDLADPVVRSDVFGSKVADLPLMSPNYRYSSPVTRFGEKYRNEIARSSLIDLHLNANLIDISLHENHNSVSQFVFRSDEKSLTYSIEAEQFVLCCGGLENPRVLLNANKQMPNGIGNQQDLVGRHFCEHIVVPVGKAVMRSEHTSAGFNICSNALMHSKNCLSFLVEFGFSTLDQDTSFFERVYQAIFEEEDDASEAEIYIMTQQACNPDSRVTLSDERDWLGLRQLQLNWKQSALDQHTIRTAAMEVAQSLAIHDLGRMKLASFILEKNTEIPMSYMNHHMCTTRMSEDASSGVVDRHCKVFGMDNLFIGGSSVFASAGVSNPTYTIVQLALRLGDHIDELFR